MRSLTRKFTYTNVVGTLALFIALGGVSWAATLPKNSVGPAQLKKNAVTSKAIKDKTITGGDFKNGTLTGARISLASLGEVPKADSAGSASAISSRSTPIIKRVAPSASDPNSTTALHAAADVVLVANGSVSLVGKCFTSGSSVYAYLIGRSTEDGALASYGGGNGFYGSPGYLNPGQADETAYLAAASASSNSVGSIGSSYYGIGTLVGKDRHGLQFHVNVWAKNGSPAAGDGAYGPGNSCVFAGSASKT